MSNTKHTPGPWVTSTLPNGTEWTVSADGGDMLADLTGCPNEKANAALIAEAPNLLVALQGLVADWERVMGRPIPDDHEAKAAIHAATGGDAVSTTKHTPGPWHMGVGNGKGSIFAERGRTRLEQGGTTLYPIATVVRGWDAAEDDANARLLAEAPVLLALLIQAYEDADSEILGAEWNAEARAAIAKATGGDL